MSAAQSLLDKYLTGPLERLELMAKGVVKLNKEQVLKSLRLVLRIVWGCSEVLPVFYTKGLGKASPQSPRLQVRGQPVRLAVLEVGTKHER